MDLEPLITDFAARDGESAFPKLARGDVAEGLRRRIADPVSLDQGAATFSGPAAFLFCLLNDRPELYLQYVIDVFERGRATIGAFEVAPGEACREAAPPAERIAAVDWVALASLRDSEMTIVDYDNANDTGLPLTHPSTMAGWFAAAGYRQVRNDADPFFPKSRREAAHLRSLYLQGRRICLFISADMLHGFGNRTWTLRPNQWAVLASPVMLTNDTVAMMLYEWGVTRRVPPAGSLALEHFCRNFYGSVTAMPPPQAAVPL